MRRARATTTVAGPGIRAVLAVTAVMVTGPLGCKGGDTRTPALEPARRAPPTRAEPTPTGFIGVVVAGESAEIEPKAEGRIEQVFVSAGDAVAQGAPLARLDGKGMRHELDVASAGLREAQRRFERRRKLARSNAAAVTAEELEGAEREVLQERARVAKLSEALAEALVTAPFAGTVAERYLAAGAMAGPGRAIVRLVSAGEPRVRFAIPEERAAGVVPGRLVDVAIAPLGLSLRGRVSGINPEVDTSSRMVYATAALEPLPADASASRLSTGLITRVFLAEGMAASIEHTPAPSPEGVPPPPSTTTTLSPPPAPSPAPRPAPRPARKRESRGVDKW
jgi:RND family efflux transporter MFP subunit